MASSSGQFVLSKIKAYYEDYPDTTQFISEFNDSTSTSTSLDKDIQQLQVTEPDKSEAFRKEFLYIGGPEVILSSKKNTKKEAPKGQQAKENASSSS